MKFYAILFSVFVFSSLFGSDKKQKYDYDLCVCAIFRDEAPYLKEWIEFHRLVGIQKFYLYNNASTDNYKEVLQRYINKEIVYLTEWPEAFSNGVQIKAKT
jgi:Glycosyltransferase family 92